MKLLTRGLTVAVVAAVGFVPLAATTGSAFAAPTASDLDNHWGRLVLLDTSNNTYVSFDNDLKGEREGDLYEAEADADFFDIPKIGRTASISNLESGETLKADQSLAGGLDYAAGSIADDAFNFEVSADGSVKTSTGKYVGFDDQTGRLAAQDTPRYHFAGSAATETVSLVAGLDSYDGTTSSAILSGSATSSVLDEVQIKVGSTFVTTEYNGRWLLLASGLTPGQKGITVEQWVNGVKLDERVVPLDDGSVGETFVPLTVTSDHTYAADTPKELRGKATPGSKVTATNQWGSFVGEAEANDKGEWSFTRSYGPTASYTLTFVQVAKDGKTDTVGNFALAPAAEAFEDLTVTNGHTYTANTPFELKGTATPGATISVTNQWNAPVATIKVTNGNTWSYSRLFGPTAAYTLNFVQTTPDGKTDTVGNFALSPAGVSQPLSVTSDTDNSTYTPGIHTFAGTGAAGAKVTAKNQWDTTMGTASVGSDGTWKFDRNLGPTADYALTFTMSGSTDTVTLNLKGPQ